MQSPLIDSSIMLGSRREQQTFEVMLAVVCAALTWLLYYMDGYKMVILNLYFLPVALGGLFLGRYRAGVLALFCVICASIVTTLRLTDMVANVSPLVVALAITVWAAVLGLTAMLIGTLSDDRAAKLKELHEAYVGVVEVLTQYLQSANPRLKARSVRVAEMSQEVAAAMRLTPEQIDDIRVAALLYDVGQIEVTTKVIQRAMDSYEDELTRGHQHTFQGMDLMLSLGSVLRGAIPLLLNQDSNFPEVEIEPPVRPAAEVPLGARIIRTARAYCALIHDRRNEPRATAREALDQLRRGPLGLADADVLEALGRVVARQTRTLPDDAVVLPIDAMEEVC